MSLDSKIKNMKVAFTVLHGNVTDSNKRFVGNNEMFELARLLNKYCEVDILSCKDCEGTIKVDDTFDINKYDALFIMNGSVNMFGGLEVKTATTIYKLMHNFNNQVYYLLTDLLMPFVNYYEHIKGKDFNVYNEHDFDLKKDLIIISQFSNKDYVRKIHKKVNIKEIYYLPLAYWYIDNHYLDNKFDFVEKTVDLIYGGSFRAGNRLKKMIEYFFNREQIKVELYGNIKLSQFKLGDNENAPEFTGKVQSQDVIAKNKTSLSTIIIGDKNYNNNTITLRFIEALMSDIICFIDNDFDKEHKLFENDYFYVNSGEELEKKILEIKSNESLKETMLAFQKNKLEELSKYDLGKHLLEVLNENKIN